jgi:serine protease AprX
MAAPHVTGAVALLLEADPALTPSEIKSILQSTSVPVRGAGPDEQGAGVIDVAAALARAAKKRTAAVTRVGVST